MTHRATPRFWACYQKLPEDIQRLADRCHELLLKDPRHPSLISRRSANFGPRVGLHYRAIAVEDGDDLIWVWIGTHAEYDRLLQQRT